MASTVGRELGPNYRVIMAENLANIKPLILKYSMYRVLCSMYTVQSTPLPIYKSTITQILN